MIGCASRPINGQQVLCVVSINIPSPEPPQCWRMHSYQVPDRGSRAGKVAICDETCSNLRAIYITYGAVCNVNANVCAAPCVHDAVRHHTVSFVCYVNECI